MSRRAIAVKGTKRYDGCFNVEVFVQKKENHVGTVHVLTLQTWADVNSHKKYLDYRAATGYQQTFSKFLSGPTVTRTYRLKTINQFVQCCAEQIDFQLKS